MPRRDANLVTVDERSHLRALGWETYPGYVRATPKLLLEWLFQANPDWPETAIYLKLAEIIAFDNRSANHEHTIAYKVRALYEAYFRVDSAG